MSEQRREPLELWGGLECTINRVGDRFIDQLALVGAYALDDLVELVRSTGIRRVRWPVLWERVASADPSTAWTWSDGTLSALLEGGIEPIVGLVHHGSGPLDTSLLDPAFPARLASYARLCVERYPAIRCYTPVNEPLTTSRFSALYGHWYPHRLDDRAFVTALVNQIRGVIEAMIAIRRVRPDAALIQTEDAGRTTATTPLSAQAMFEEHRRWLSLDLLMGRVGADHPLRDYLAQHGFDREQEAWFQEHAITPEVVGLNYYVTSDRHLDHRLDRHLPATHGGNGIVRYADLEAARADGIGLRTHDVVLNEAWLRYGQPVAITEAHLGCTREEQLRWLRDAWNGACAAREAGTDVRAVTVWAMLGSTDWDSLLTRSAGHYEPGPYDLRGGTPRRTALASAAASLASGGRITHPAAEGPGWWERAPEMVAGRTPLVILGATGTLGRAFTFACQRRGLAYRALTRNDLDVLDPAAVRETLARIRPWAVVNATGYVRVDDAEREKRACRQVNAVAPAILAMTCRKLGIRLATFSSDLVFDGCNTEPYREMDAVAPLNTYGRSKVEGERRVLAINPGALVVRTSAFFGPWDRANFVTLALERLRQRQPFRALSDLTVSPTYVPDLVDTTLDLLIDDAEGVWHLANRGAVTWFELAQLAATRAGLDAATLDSCCSEAASLAAPRPRYSVLGTSRGALLPPLDEALDRYFAQCADAGHAA
jgi:dTDP-4-dehydrorhamnose reductase